jgi:5-formyltetrahydrofolate cyclo-ligase
LKQELRKTLLYRRDSIPPDKKLQKETAIRESLFGIEAFRKAKCLLLYASFRSEVDTLKYLDDIISSGKKLVLPLVDREHKSLSLYEVKDASELAKGYMGIPEPGITEGREVDLKDIDLIIIPGTGFDPHGNRLGYGGGYYDRLLGNAEKHLPAIALAFEEQLAEQIPAEPHDIKMDIIITDKRVITVP